MKYNMKNNNAPEKVFIMGNEAVVQAALAAGARIMYGYPITPTTEILEEWIKLAPIHKTSYLQTEDEMAAGFAMIGACLAGVKAFSATAGPGNILMQDAFAMAEALRIPTVAIIQQRGGLSTSTVIYSQEEVNLTCFGGNGEGFRVVYSTAGLQDLYDYTIKAFNTAWKYRFPTFVLGDGYQAKMKGEVTLHQPQQLVDAKPILLADKKSISGKEALFKSYFPYINQATQKPLPNVSLGDSVNLRNCFNLEEETFEIIESYKYDFKQVAPEIEEFENVYTEDAELVVFAHGIVAAAAKIAVEHLRKEGVSVGLFRPITLSPFPTEAAVKSIQHARKILITESALGQFGKIIRDVLYGETDIPMVSYYRPGLGITPEELIEQVRKIV